MTVKQYVELCEIAERLNNLIMQFSPECEECKIGE